MKDKRLIIDKVLSEWCEYFGVTWTDIHDDAFCVQHKQGYWLYIWYGEYEPVSDYLRELESLLDADNLNFKEINECKL